MTSSENRVAVLHVALNPLTGPWSVMKELAQAQVKSGLYAGVGIGVITPKDWPLQYSDQLEHLGLPYFRCHTPKMFGTASFLYQLQKRPPIGEWAAEMGASFSADMLVVHFHNAWMSGVFLPLRNDTKTNRIAVATFHGVNAQLNGKPLRWLAHRYMARRLRRYDARLTSVDSANLFVAKRVLGLPMSLFTVIPNGVPSSAAEALPFLKGSSEFTVGHVGSITERKGWALAAEAVIALRKEGLPVRLLIAGRGPQQEQAAFLARKNTDCISFLGLVNSPRETLMPRLDLLSVMSRHEGLPMTIIEAMSLGIPVAATNVGGVPEAVHDGQTGRIIPRSSEALADVVRVLYENPEILKVYSTAARSVFLDKFDIAKIVRRYHSVYCGLRDV